MIECENLELRPGGRTLTTSVPRGGFVWLAGPAGSGKTTLLQRFGARRPVGAVGRASVLGVDLGSAGPRARARLRRRIGFLDEEPVLLAGLSVIENIALPSRIRGTRAARAVDEAIATADWLGIGGLLDRDADRLSRGERQLCAVARAVVGRPAVLLADEPGAGLDEQAATRVVLLLAELAELGTTVLVATRLGPGHRAHRAPELSLGPCVRPDPVPGSFPTPPAPIAVTPAEPAPVDAVPTQHGRWSRVPDLVQ